MVDGIYGASEDNSRLDKDQVIRWAFQHIDFDENAGELKAHGAYRILDSVDELAQAVEEYFA